MGWIFWGSWTDRQTDRHQATLYYRWQIFKFSEKNIFINPYIPEETKKATKWGEITRKGLRAINTVNPFNNNK